MDSRRIHPHPHCRRFRQAKGRDRLQSCGPPGPQRWTSPGDSWKYDELPASQRRFWRRRRVRWIRGRWRRWGILRWRRQFRRGEALAVTGNNAMKISSFIHELDDARLVAEIAKAEAVASREIRILVSA